MDIRTINDLLDASAQGDSPEARLESLLRAIRKAFFGTSDNPPAIWIAKKGETGEDEVLAGISHTDSAYKTELRLLEKPSNLYLAFSTRPAVSEDLIQAASKLVAKALMELIQERKETLIYGLLNSFREDIFHPAEPLGRKDMSNVAKDVAAAFCNPQVWSVLYDFRSWRQPRTKPLVVSYGDGLTGTSSNYFNEQINTEIHKLLLAAASKRDSKPDSSIGETVIIPPPAGQKDGLRIYIACAGLASSQEPDPVSGVPYFAVALKEDDDHTLDVEQRRLLERFVKELQRVLRLRENLGQIRGLGSLLEEFLSLSTPNEVAQSAIDFLAERFSTSEVAVLERRGMFLSIIGQKNVPLKQMPPLHITNTPARVTLVARTGQELYDKNVRHEKDSYLAVVDATKSQLTVPLVWRGDLVGVLLIGLPVVDGLELRDRQFIRALAGYCAAAIAGSQRTSDERAVTHMLREVLTGAALNLRQVIESDEVKSADRTQLQGTYDLVDHCQTFIQRFRQAQAAGYKPVRIDLREVILRYEAEPLVNAILENHPGCSIEMDAGSDPLIANVDYESIHLALNNLVVNALESMEKSPGRVRVSLRKERVWYKAHRRYVYYGVISVEDQGKGLSPQEQSKIFDLFYTTKPQHLGTGLRIAQNIIEKFGGRIEIQSPPADSETGSVFSLWIPILQRGSIDARAA